MGCWREVWVEPYLNHPNPVQCPRLSDLLECSHRCRRHKGEMISGYSFLNTLISSLGSKWLLHLYIFGGWPTNTILQQSWRKVLFSMKQEEEKRKNILDEKFCFRSNGWWVEEDEKRKCKSGGKVLFSIKQVVGGGDGSHTPGTAAGQRHLVSCTPPSSSLSSSTSSSSSSSLSSSS